MTFLKFLVMPFSAIVFILDVAFMYREAEKKNICGTIYWGMWVILMIITIGRFSF